jgi:hypothetical protein
VKTKLLIFFSLGLILSACNQPHTFSNSDDQTGAGAPGDNNPPNNSQNNPTPPKPDPAGGKPTLPPEPLPLVYTSGGCTLDGVDVLPCMKCQLKAAPPVEQLSIKAQEFIAVMAAGCAQKNGSDPKNYQPPTKQELLNRLNRADEINYPTSPVTSSRQRKLIDDLMKNDPGMVKKMFGGLWYHPPYSDDFETYFGLEVREARYLFCYRKDTGTFSYSEKPEALMSKDYIDCRYDSFFCKELPNYVQANVYRQQLWTSLHLSVESPAIPPAPQPANHCHWEKISGVYGQEMEDRLIAWINHGYSIAAYIDGPQARCQSFKELSKELKGNVTLGAYTCDDSP